MSYSPVPFTAVLLVSTNRCRHIRRDVDGKRAMLSYYWNKADTIRCSVVPQQQGGWVVEISEGGSNVCHFSEHFSNPSDVRSLIWGVVNNTTDDMAAVIAGAWKVYYESKGWESK